MGIKGLLQAVKPTMKAEHLKSFSGKRIAVDGYAWLHKAAYGCCVELCKGEQPKGWIQYFISMVDLLLHHNIVVTLVFDGSALPMKANTESDRENSRQSNLKKAKEYARNGDHSTARMYYSRAVDITPRMAAEVIQIIHRTRPSVSCLVSPFEADAQLSYLILQNLVDMVISEDSDTIPYGCKDIIFKLERDGSCQRLLLSDLQTQIIDKFDLRNFNADMILAMCILSGCDYLDSIKGMGLKTSYKMITKHRTVENTLKTLRIAGQLPIVPCTHHPAVDLLQYELDFYHAMLTFAHQVIFDPITRTTKHRMNITRSSFPLSILPLYWCEENNCLKSELSFLGALIEDSAVACGIADGLIDPVSKLPFNLPEIIERPMSGGNGSSNKGQPATKGNNNNGLKRTSTTTSTSVSYFKQGNNNGNNNNQSKQQRVESRGSISSHFNKLTQPALSVVSRSTSSTSASSSSSSSAVSFFQANAGSTSAAAVIGSKSSSTKMTTNSSSVSRVSIIQALRNGTYHSALPLSSAASGTVTPSSSGKASQSSAQTPMTNERVSRYFSALGENNDIMSDDVKIMPTLSSLVMKTAIEVIEIDLDDDDDDNNDHHHDNMDVYQAVEEEEQTIVQDASAMNVIVRQDDNKADKVEEEEDEEEETMCEKIQQKRKLQSYQHSTKDTLARLKRAKITQAKENIMSFLPSNDDSTPPCNVPPLSPDLITLQSGGGGYDESLTPPATAVAGCRGGLSDNIFNRFSFKGE